MRGALVLAVLVVGGCADVGSRKAQMSASSVAMTVTNDLPLTHCRFGPPSGGSWQISPIKYADILSGSKRNFEVVVPYKNSTKARIKIEEHDRFTIESAAATGPASLTHFKLISGAYTVVGRATIEIEKTNTLWASGDAIEEKGKTQVGEYFVFRVPDSDGTPRNCKHSKNPTSCQTLHIEYFDATEGPVVLNQRPKLVAKNVEPLKDVSACGDGNAESGEGDTDEGPDA